LLRSFTRTLWLTIAFNADDYLVQETIKMRNRIVLILLLAAVCVPTIAFSEDARSILDAVQQKQLERWEGVDAYVVQSSVMGSGSQTYFRRSEVSDKSGATSTVFVPDARSGLHSSRCEGTSATTAEALQAYAAASGMAGETTAFESGLEQAGLPRGLLAEAGSEHMAEFANRAELVGIESIDGRQAYHLRASELDKVQQADGREYKMDAISMWIDSTEYVPLRMLVDGVLTSGSETKPLKLETVQSDYRSIPDSKMYESFKQVVKISGIMDAVEEAELKEAQAKLAEFEQQMASMPESQRQMMERMMGPQLEMMRTLAAGGGLQVEVVTSSIVVNPPLTDANGEPCPVD